MARTLVVTLRWFAAAVGPAAMHFHAGAIIDSRTDRDMVQALATLPESEGWTQVHRFATDAEADAFIAGFDAELATLEARARDLGFTLRPIDEIDEDIARSIHPTRNVRSAAIAPRIPVLESGGAT